MVPDAPFTHGDNEIAVRIFAKSNLAVLLGDAVDKLAATLVGHEKRVKAVRLMLEDPLSGSEKTEYFVVITLTAAVPTEIAQSLRREVVRWRKASLKIARTRTRRSFEYRDE
jgi:hypothetical protein